MAAGFTGTDRFELDVSYTGGRTVHADIEIVVRRYGRDAAGQRPS